MRETVNAVALLFPGGGTQYVGMGKELCAAFKVAARTFEHASDLLHYDLLKVCTEKDLEYISEMDISQPAIFTASVASFRVFEQEIGIKPRFALGHSLGEYAALAAAGVFSFEDALTLVQKRGRYLKEAGDEINGGMMAVNKIRRELVEQSCNEVNQMGNGRVYVSAYNSPLQHVVSGDRTTIKTLSDVLVRKGGDIAILNINTPSHCPLMMKAAQSFEKDLGVVEMRKFVFPVVSNVFAAPYQESDDIRKILTANMTQPVQWEQSISYVFKHGVTHLIDIGPQAVMKNLSLFIKEKFNAFAFDIDADVVAIREIFGRPAFDPMTFIARCMTLAVSTRNDASDLPQYENKVVQAYERIKAIRKVVETSGAGLHNDLIRETLVQLRDILHAKNVPANTIQNKLKTLVIGTSAQEIFFDFLHNDTEFSVVSEKKIR